MSAKNVLALISGAAFGLAASFALISTAYFPIEADYSLSDSAGREAPLSVNLPVDFSHIFVGGMVFSAFSPRMLYRPDSGTFYPAGAARVSSPLMSVPAENVTTTDVTLFKDRAVLVTKVHPAYFAVIAEIMAESGAKAVIFEVQSGKPKSPVLPDFRQYLGLYSIPMFQTYKPVDWYTRNMVAPMVTVEIFSCSDCNPDKRNRQKGMIFVYVSLGFVIVMVIALVALLCVACVSET